MAKAELKELLESYEGYINDIPLVINPVRCVRFTRQKVVMTQDILIVMDNGMTVIPARCVVGIMTVSLR